jgi:glutamyl-tRNA synthetase/glutamyl-Q tRNA(Asp) synthetase
VTAVGRFAPSITGVAHPGTMLAALLCWLDLRSRGGRVLLRLEDLDTTRLRPGYLSLMLEALDWLGLSWDEVTRQSELAHQHEAALDALGAQGRLYACSCSRKERRASGRRAPDGGFAYDNRCRERVVGADWRDCKEPLRVRLPDRRVELVDEGGTELSQTPAHDMGDPIVRRRDGVVAYHLAVVVDDGACGVNRVVRGRDLAASTATQVLLCELLDIPVPSYRHHFLLLEGERGKLAKLHGSIGYRELCWRISGAEMCGLLARLAGLGDGGPCTPEELVPAFDWSQVRQGDLLFDASEGLAR